MSATATHSSTEWIVALTTPTSTTSAPVGAMKRPSDVPPPVDSSGSAPRRFTMLAAHGVDQTPPFASETAGPTASTTTSASSAVAREYLGDRRAQPLRRLFGVEAEVEQQLERARDDVGRAGAARARWKSESSSRGSTSLPSSQRRVASSTIAGAAR